ncbi:hypothetical protein [Frankia nepalensis]|uniref:Uncharacterized protein n=1 Tax=Frankia nepalensis TaxID=1836974 RepID=A0A937RN89_9ACTN|nr:hypothetical protein [Frankia nepalensis]MBL7500686.1 hypothetical protein [Frankia nepalensis]MBL7513128.1 hypothetical protein [Frankia nepalensis]MBL7633597.1 hypothetical protein [Frankia nepalensis]
MTCRTAPAHRAGRPGSARSGVRAFAVLVGLYAGLATVPADGVPARLAVVAATVALVVLATGRPARSGAAAPAARRDLASVLAVALTLLASAGAAFAPPTLG